MQKNELFTLGKLFDGLIIVGDIFLGGFLGRIVAASLRPENGPAPITLSFEAWVAIYILAGIGFLVSMFLFREPVKYASRRFDQAGDWAALWMLAGIAALGFTAPICLAIGSLNVVSWTPLIAHVLIVASFALFFGSIYYFSDKAGILIPEEYIDQEPMMRKIAIGTLVAFTAVISLAIIIAFNSLLDSNDLESANGLIVGVTGAGFYIFFTLLLREVFARLMENAGSLMDKTPPSDFMKQKIIGFFLAFPLLILTLAPLNALVSDYNIMHDKYLFGFELVVAVGFRAAFFAAIAWIVVYPLRKMVELPLGGKLEGWQFYLSMVVNYILKLWL